MYLYNEIHPTCAFRPISPAALRALGETADAGVSIKLQNQFICGTFRTSICE